MFEKEQFEEEIGTIESENDNLQNSDYFSESEQSGDEDIVSDKDIPLSKLLNFYRGKERMTRNYYTMEQTHLHGM